jgi:hypothetical protein
VRTVEDAECGAPQLTAFPARSGSLSG